MERSLGRGQFRELTPDELHRHYERYIGPYFNSDGRVDLDIARQAVDAVAAELGVASTCSDQIYQADIVGVDHVSIGTDQQPNPGLVQDYGAFTWDRFYHVILPQDAHLLSLLGELGLEPDLRWKTTGTGMVVWNNFAA